MHMHKSNFIGLVAVAMSLFEPFSTHYVCEYHTVIS